MLKDIVDMLKYTQQFSMLYTNYTIIYVGDTWCSLFTHKLIRTYTLTHTTHINSHTYANIYTNIQTQVDTNTDIHTFVHTYIHMHTPYYSHTNTQTQLFHTNSCRKSKYTN